MEHGLLNVKRTCNWMSELLRASEYASDGRRATAELTAKWSEGESAHLQDQTSHFVHGCTLLQEVTMHSYTATESFRKGAQAEVAALYAFYKSAQARRRDTTKEHARMVSAWASMEESLSKERRECAKAYSELRVAQDAKDKEEVAETANKELYPKLLKRWKGAREVCVKKFAAFEKSFERARSVQEANDAAHLPHMLEELERIERERLALLAEFTTRFGALFSTWAADIRSSAVLIEKVAPALQCDKAVSSLFDSWMLRFGTPPALQPVRYDLPCSAAVVAGEELPPENAPLLAAIGSVTAVGSFGNGNGNGNAATPLSPSSASSSSAAMAAPTGGFSSPPLSPASTGLVGTRRAAAPGPPPPPTSLGSGSYPPVVRTVHVPPPIPQANNVAAAAAAAASASTSDQVRPVAAAATSPLTASQPLTSGSSDASSRASAVPPPLAPAPAAATTAVPAAATAVAPLAVAPAGAARSTVKVGVIGRTMRAPPPSLPTKRKPKVPGEPDIDISCLPPPPLPPPVTQESASYHRMSMTTAAAAAAAGRQSVARAAGPPPLPGAADSSAAAAAAASPSSRGPPPLPAGVARVGPPPPPLPVAASVTAAAAPVAVEQPSAGAATAEPEATSQAQGQPSESEAPSTAQEEQSSLDAAASAPTTEDFDASACGPDDIVEPALAAAEDAPAAEPQPETSAAESELGAADAAATAAADEAAPVEPAVEAAAAADQVESDPSSAAAAAAAADDATSAVDDSGQQQGWPATALYDFSLSEDTASVTHGNTRHRSMHSMRVHLSFRKVFARLCLSFDALSAFFFLFFFPSVCLCPVSFAAAATSTT